MDPRIGVLNSGRLYRRDVPRQAKAHGFYSFSDHRIEWQEID
jgi:hypothetical protein